MIRRAVAAALVLGAAPAAAFEAEPTHAAMTEAAAFASPLDEALRRWGYEDGLYASVEVALDERDRVAAAGFRWRLARLDPASGHAPAFGRARGVGWLIAGSVMEEIPAERARHHFFDPARSAGLADARPGLAFLTSLLGAVDADETLAGLFTGMNFDGTGVPATRWILDEANDLSWTAWLRHLLLAATSPEPRVRDAQLARALLALGGVLHVLQDMASPSHVRNDFRGGHLERLGSTVFDRGSRFEHYVALSWGATAPGPGAAGPGRVRLRDFFSAADGRGLADFTARQFFSAGTLPWPVAVGARPTPEEIALRVNAALARPEPRVRSIRSDRRGRAGTGYARGLVPHLARYRIDRSGRVRTRLDGECLRDYARVLVPEAVRASRDLIAFALRGRLRLVVEDGGLRVDNDGVAVARGRLDLYWEDHARRRHPLAEAGALGPTRPGAALAHVTAAPPAGARRLVAVFDGRDARGEPIVIVETLALAANGSSRRPGSRASGPGARAARARRPRRAPRDRGAARAAARADRAAPRGRRDTQGPPP